MSNSRIELETVIRVLIACVNYKRPEDTLACLASLKKASLPGGQILVGICDNSPDHSQDRLHNGLVEMFDGCSSASEKDLTLYGTPEAGFRAFLYQSHQNGGFAAGNNACLKASQRVAFDFTHCWFLNNDTEIEKACLHEMILKIQKKGGKTGICGSTMVYYHDKRTIQALGGSEYRPWTGTMQEIGNGQQWPLVVDEADVEARMSYVCGASMLVTADFVRDIGVMNEDYFLFFEEIDWCERGRRAGYELAYASRAVVFHKEGASIGTGVGAKRSLLAEYYGMRNKLLISKRFFPWALPGVWLISWLQVLRRIVQRRPENAKVMAKVLVGLGQPPY